MKTAPLLPETTEAILDAAWSLIVQTGRAEVTLAEIARAAGVSRQSLYLAFGNRAGLLTAMARRHDAASPRSLRMGEIAESPDSGPEALTGFVEAWLGHLPEIYPVVVLLSAAAVTDSEVAQVLSDRMVDGLLNRYAAILCRMASAGHLAPGWEPAPAAEFCWSLTHVEAWKHLVVERGWSPEAFRESRLRVIRATLIRA